MKNKLYIYFNNALILGRKIVMVYAITLIAA